MCEFLMVRFSRNSPLIFKVAGEEFSALEVGTFSPEEKAQETLQSGEIGYIVTGIKQPGIASVGDTVAYLRDTHSALSGLHVTQAP